jgi:hypothetical protein
MEGHSAFLAYVLLRPHVLSLLWCACVGWLGLLCGVMVPPPPPLPEPSPPSGPLKRSPAPLPPSSPASVPSAQAKRDPSTPAPVPPAGEGSKDDPTKTQVLRQTPHNERERRGQRLSGMPH